MRRWERRVLCVLIVVLLLGVLCALGLIVFGTLILRSPALKNAGREANP